MDCEHRHEINVFLYHNKNTEMMMILKCFGKMFVKNRKINVNYLLTSLLTLFNASSLSCINLLATACILSIIAWASES